MTDYTRQINTLTKQASATPQFNAPSNSLGADLANLANTGMQIYQQFDAKKKLEVAQGEQQAFERQQAEQEKFIDNAAMGLRDLRLELLANNVSGTTFLERENAYVKRFGPAGSAVIKRARDLTGDNSRGIIKDLNALNREEERLAREQQERDFELRQAAVEEAVRAGIAFDPTSATDEEARVAILRGTAARALEAKVMADLEKENKTARNQAQRENAQDRAFETIATDMFVKNINSQLGNAVKALGGFNPTTAPAITQFLVEKRGELGQRFREDYVSKARELGVYVSQDTINRSIASAESGVDSLIGMLSSETTLKAVQNNSSLIFEGGLLDALSSKNEAVKQSASLIMASEYTNSPLDIGTFATELSFMSKAVEGYIDTSEPNIKDRIKALEKAMIPTQTPTPEDSPTRYIWTESILDSMLTGTDKQQKAVVQNGGYEAIVNVLAKTGSSIVSPEGKERQLDNLYRQGAKVLSATIGNFNIYRDLRTEEANQYEFNPSASFKLDEKSFQIVPTSSTVPSNSKVNELNRLMSKQLKAFEELGADEEFINRFKNDVALSIGISPTSR